MSGFSLVSSLTLRWSGQTEINVLANFGLNSEEYCVTVPRQNTLGYLNLNSVSDVFLDTFSWSGGNTTLEAIAFTHSAL